MSRKAQSAGPLCKLCGATNSVGFAMFPKTKGYGFGDICENCDENPPAPSGWDKVETSTEDTPSLAQSSTNDYRLGDNKQLMAFIRETYGVDFGWLAEGTMYDSTGQAIGTHDDIMTCFANELDAIAAIADRKAHGVE